MGTFAATVFCTPADVRARLKTPGKALALTEHADTQYPAAFTGATCSSTLPIANNNVVSFVSTGTLPTGLTNGTGYYVINRTGQTFQVATTPNGSAITPSGGSGTLSVYNAELDLAIQEKIAIAKDAMRQDLINYLQQKLPSTISTMLAFKRSQMNALQSGFNRTIELLDRGTGSWSFPSYGYVTFEGLFYSVNNYQSFGAIPALRVNYGTPTSGSTGTFAGMAEQGSLLADIQNAVLYINRGTSTSPAWNIFLPSDGIDHLLNPTELQRPMTSRTIMEMSVDAAFRNMAQATPFVEAGTTNFAIEFWRKQYKEDLDRAMSCLDINIDGSGLMNDWMRGFTRSEIVICG